MPHRAALVLVFSASIVCGLCISTPGPRFEFWGQPIAEMAASLLRGSRQVLLQKARKDDKCGFLKLRLEKRVAARLAKTREKKLEKTLTEINSLEAQVVLLQKVMTPVQLAAQQNISGDAPPSTIYQDMIRCLQAPNYRAQQAPESDNVFSDSVGQLNQMIVLFCALKDHMMQKVFEGQHDAITMEIDRMTRQLKEGIQELQTFSRQSSVASLCPCLARIQV